MKLLTCLVAVLLSGTVLLAQSSEQNDLDSLTQLNALHIRHVHVTNNIGWGIPLGQTSDILSGKYSSSLGLDISLKDSAYFLYPYIDFLSFRYHQRKDDPDTPYQVRRGHSNFFILNLTAGMRKRTSSWGIYGFVGPGLGLRTEPRAYLQSDGITMLMKNRVTFTPSLKGGTGLDYKIGHVYAFAELSYLYNFRTLQDRQVHILAAYIGVKTNVTKVADKVIEFIGDQTAH